MTMWARAGASSSHRREGNETMLRLAIFFFILAGTAGLLGFGGFVNYAWDGLKLLCVVCFVLAMASFVGDLIRRPSA